MGRQRHPPQGGYRTRPYSARSVPIISKKPLAGRSTLPYPLDGKDRLGSGEGGQRQQPDESHKLVLRLGGGIGVLAEHGAGHEPGRRQG